MRAFCKLVTLVAFLSTSGRMADVRAQAGDHYHTPRPWIDGAPRPTPDPEDPELEERRLFRREDILPPPQPPDYRKVALEGVEYRSQQVLVRSDIIQIDMPRRKRTKIYTADGESLSYMTAKDFNDDGIREVIIGFSPPRNSTNKRFVVFVYNTRDHRFVEAFDTGPLDGGKVRFLPAKAERADELGLGAREWLLAVDDPGLGAKESFRTRVYRQEAEKMKEIATYQPRPLTHHDKLIWAREAFGQGNFIRAQELANQATASTDPAIRTRALYELARVELALEKVPEAKKVMAALDEVEDSGDSVYGIEIARYRELMARPGATGAVIAALVQGEALLQGKGDREVEEKARLALEKDGANPLADELLMLRARALMGMERPREALEPLSRIVMDHPQSPHFRRAQEWVVQIESAAPGGIAQEK